jgi:hypothetical protein
VRVSAKGKVMAGRHSKSRGAVHVRIPEQRRLHSVGIIDGHTRVEHLVSEEVFAAYCHAGRFIAKCGTEVLAASMAEPGWGRCAECAQ